MKRPKTPKPVATPPPVASTSADAGRRLLESRRTRKRRYGYEDTLLGGSRTGSDGLGFSDTLLD